MTYQFSDFGIGYNVSKIKCILKSLVNLIIDVCWHSSLPSFSLLIACSKENQAILGSEYLTMMNHFMDIFPSKNK